MKVSGLLHPFLLSSASPVFFSSPRRDAAKLIHLFRDEPKRASICDSAPSRAERDTIHPMRLAARLLTMGHARALTLAAALRRSDPSRIADGMGARLSGSAVSTHSGSPRSISCRGRWSCSPGAACCAAPGGVGRWLARAHRRRRLDPRRLRRHRRHIAALASRAVARMSHTGSRAIRMAG
jgi:hypothetical protein